MAKIYRPRDTKDNGQTAHLKAPIGDPDETIAVSNTLALEAARPVWRDIDDAARSGADFLVRFADPDINTRLARWRLGRYFTGRRWVHSGRWVAADTLMPLPEQPTEYLVPAENAPSPITLPEGEFVGPEIEVPRETLINEQHLIPGEE